MSSGCGTEEFVRELVEHYLDADDRFSAAVRSGFAALDRGDYLEEEEIDARVDRIYKQIR